MTKLEADGWRESGESRKVGVDADMTLVNVL
jgi:hypothetical protein